MFRDYGDRLPDRSLQWAQTNVSLTQRWEPVEPGGQCVLVPRPHHPGRHRAAAGARVQTPGAPAARAGRAVRPVPGRRVVHGLPARGRQRRGASRLSSPASSCRIPVGGYFTITPFTGPRFTFYNTRAVGTSFVAEGVWVEDVIHKNSVRQQIEEGVIVESRASRVFQLDGAPRRHRRLHPARDRASHWRRWRSTASTRRRGPSTTATSTTSGTSTSSPTRSSIA